MLFNAEKVLGEDKYVDLDGVKHLVQSIPTELALRLSELKSRAEKGEAKEEEIVALQRKVIETALPDIDLMKLDARLFIPLFEYIVFGLHAEEKKS